MNTETAAGSITPPIGPLAGQLPAHAPWNPYADDDPGSATGKRLWWLVFGAIGVVFGDIGTSPLYAMKEAFDGPNRLPADTAHILGLLSLITWSLVIVVSLKYTLLMMRADNKGQGGSLALLALVGQLPKGRFFKHLVMLLGISAGALFYGDSMITPAISVLGAVEGLEVALPAVENFIVPITLVVLVLLFLVQSHGTATVGKLFGPVMVVWFATIAVTGVYQILQEPAVLAALSPVHAFTFFLRYKLTAFLALGAVVLVLTGAEALYADMGHFGRKPIRRAWFLFVFPALLLNYFGQGALLLNDRHAASNPFYRMVPDWAVLPMVGLATLAAVIASQAVISGAFSLTRQAMQLGYLPRMKTVHTSATEIGQIYIPFVNWMLLVFVVALVLGFKSSSQFAAAYGVAVTGTMLIDSILVTMVMFMIWRWPVWTAAPIAIGLMVVDIGFFTANATKIPHGGWFPLVVGAAAFVLLTTWKRGRELLMARRAEEAMPEDAFLKSLNPNVTRVAGTSVFLSGAIAGVPHALLHNLKHNRVVHERVVFLTVVIEEVPHVGEARRLEIQHLGRRFYRFIVRYGYLDDTDIPGALRSAARFNFEFNNLETSFFLGRDTIIPSGRPGMALWRERLFAWMTRSATTAMDFFKLPPNRVVELGTQVEI
ncbi:MAG: potassium transporter Kup [Rhodospirillaceae bacterium]|nr:potassium transporter Kup [Rhodospirillaceae bacterium]